MNLSYVNLMPTHRIPEADGSALGVRLRAARARLGWSRETLAHHSGMSWAAIAQIESGRRTNVRPGTLTALASALRVTVDYLLGSEGEQKLLEHRALLYGSKRDFLGTTAPFLRGAVERSEAALVVTSPANIDLLARELGRDADRVFFENSSGWYRSPLDAVNACREFALEQVTAGAPWVSVVGELLWAADDDIRPWVTYEAMFNLVFASSPLTVICPYDTGSVHAGVLESAKLTHPSVIWEAEAARNPAYLDPVDYVLGRR
jgi:transcriptional regulator with XRE-family HTH domain